MTARQVFERFVPEQSVDYCVELYESHGFEFKITRARRTKLGDFRYDPDIRKFTITVNNDLNPYAFLITYLHEVAHLFTYKQHQDGVLPHGEEWKNVFKEVTKPLLNTDVFPEPVLHTLLSYFKNPKASSCSDPKLQMILKQFDRPNGKVFLKALTIGSEFLFNQRHFRKLQKRRTRSLCLELKTNRRYYISEIAEVVRVEISGE
jgi:SprT protein